MAAPVCHSAMATIRSRPMLVITIASVALICLCYMVIPNQTDGRNVDNQNKREREIINREQAIEIKIREVREKTRELDNMQRTVESKEREVKSKERQVESMEREFANSESTGEIRVETVNTKEQITENRERSQSVNVRQQPQMTSYKRQYHLYGTGDGWNDDNCVYGCFDGRCLRTYTDIQGQSFSAKINTSTSEDAEKRSDLFKNVFKKKYWDVYVSRGKDVVSGMGSRFERTQVVRELLDVIIERIKNKYNKSTVRMLDVPCGDFTWMSEFLSKRSDVIYTGMDIVPDLVEKHKKQYENATSRMSFICQDIASRPLDAQYDLIFSRHMMMHLMNADALKALKHISDNNVGYVLMTTNHISENSELIRNYKRDVHRVQNFELPPYSLIPPLCEETEKPVDINMGEMALWKLPLLQIQNS